MINDTMACRLVCMTIKAGYRGCLTYVISNDLLHTAGPYFNGIGIPGGVMADLADICRGCGIIMTGFYVSPVLGLAVMTAGTVTGLTIGCITIDRHRMSR